MNPILKPAAALILATAVSGCATNPENEELQTTEQCRVVTHETSKESQTSKPSQTTTTTTTTQTSSSEQGREQYQEETTSESGSDKGYFLIFPNKYYIGGGVSRGVALDGEVDDKPAEPNLNLLVGMRLSPDWALEFNYFFPSDAPFNDEGVNVDVEYKQWEIAGKYDYYLTNRLGLYGRFGTAKWDSEKKLPDDPHFQSDFNTDGWSLIVEGGAFYRITNDFTIQGGYHFTPGIGDSSSGEFTSRRLMMNLTWDFGFEESAVFLSEE